MSLVDDTGDFLATLPTVVKAWSALAGAVGIGFTAAVLWLGDRVELNAEMIATNTSTIIEHLDAPGHPQAIRNDQIIMRRLEYATCLIRLELTDSAFTPFQIVDRCGSNEESN